MENYKDAYLYLFNKLSDLNSEIISVQQAVEEMYLKQNDNEINFPIKKAE